MSYEWLKNVKPGDTVAVQDGPLCDTYTISKVAKVTEKLGHIVLDNGRKFRSNGFGEEIGGGIRHAQLREYNEKIKLANERTGLRHQLALSAQWLDIFARNEQDVTKMKQVLDAIQAVRDATV